MAGVEKHKGLQGSLADLLRGTSYNFYVLEGFECTGKSFLADALSRETGIRSYDSRVLYDLAGDSEKIIPYDYRYITFLVIANLLGGTDTKTIIDRGVISSFVYAKLRNQNNSLGENEVRSRIIDYVRSKKVLHIYLRHSDEDAARFLFENSQKRNTHESYDDFPSFEDYMNEYRVYDRLFTQTLREVGTDYVIASAGKTNIIQETCISKIELLTDTEKAMAELRTLKNNPFEGKLYSSARAMITDILNE